MLAITVLCSDVRVYTDKNFSMPNIPTMIKFYAPWCGHCKALAPKYEELATLMGDNAVIAEVDCTTEKDICAENNIKGFPTIILFVNGQVIKYEGARETKDMKLWIEAMQEDLLQYKDQATFMKEFSESGKSTYFHFTFPESERGRFEVALMSEKGKILINCEKGEQRKLVAYRDGKKIEFEGYYQDENLQKFVRLNNIQLFTDITPGIFHDFIKAGPAIVLYGVKENVQKQYDEFVKIAKAEILPFNSGYLIADNISKDFITQFNVTPNDTALLMIDFVNDELNKYTLKSFNSESNVSESLEKLWNDYVAEKQKQIDNPKPKDAQKGKFQEILQEVKVAFKQQGGLLAKVAITTIIVTGTICYIIIKVCLKDTPVSKKENEEKTDEKVEKKEEKEEKKEEKEEKKEEVAIKQKIASNNAKRAD